MHGVHEGAVDSVHDLLLLGVVGLLATHRDVGFELCFELLDHC